MQARLGADRRPLEHLLDQIDPPARTVEFVAQQLVGRAGRGAEPAMHAGAQDRFGRIADSCAFDRFGEPGFHQRYASGD